MASGGDGRCNGVSVGGVGNKNCSSFSLTLLAVVVGGRQMRWVWRRQVVSVVFFSFCLGGGRTRT